MNTVDEIKTEPGESGLSPKQEARREVFEFFKLVFYFLILFVGLRWYAIEGYEVQGPSMEPTLHDGERILVLKLPHILSQFSLFSGIDAIKQGDIVVFESPDDPEKRYVKRVIARGPKAERGNTVSAEQHDALEPEAEVKVQYDKGNVYVNDQLVVENYVPAEENQHAESSPTIWELGPGDYYVLGDFRDVSKDSRTFGAIKDRKIIGKAVLRFWPLSRFSLLR